ncbi:MAG: DUF4919 domain-containing protein [Atribacterota bacterium]
MNKKIVSPLPSSILVLLFVICFTFSLFAQTDSTTEYTTLLERLIKGDTTIDFTRLRMLYARTPGYNPYAKMVEIKEKEKEMYAAYQKGKYQEAIASGQTILDLVYLRGMTHMILSLIYDKTNDKQKKDFHETVFFKLVDSVINSGDGKTPQTAMTVISIDEEYNVLDALGFDSEGQTLLDQDGNKYDLLKGKNSKTGESRDFYFNIDLFYGKENEIQPIASTAPEPVSGILPSPTVSLPGVTPQASPFPTPQTTFPPMIPTTPPPTPIVVPQPTAAPTLPLVSQQLVLAPPAGWVPQQPGDPSQIAYYQLPNQQGTVVAECFVLLETLSMPMNLSGYLSHIQTSRLKPPEFSGYVPQQTIETAVVGLPALRHDFLFTINNLQLKAMVVFVILGNNAYSFLFYSILKDFPILEEQFNQVLKTVTTQTGSGPQPTPSIGTTPLPPNPANVYQDPQGKFAVPLPSGATKKQDIQNGIVFRSPNNGEIYLLSYPAETEAQNAANGLAGGKTLQGQTTLNAGNHQAQVKIYSFTQNNTNYAMLLSSYPGTSFLLIIVIPADQYNQSQTWMTPMISGVQLK